MYIRISEGRGGEGVEPLGGWGGGGDGSIILYPV